MIRDEKGYLSRKAVIYSVWVAFVFYAVFGATSYISAQRSLYQAPTFSWESQIPFMPGWSLVYLTVSPLVCLAPLLFKKMEQLKEMGNAMVLQILLAAVFYLIWPLENPNEGYEVAGWAAYPFKAAETVNFSYNSFPSLHVALSINAAVFYSRAVKKAYSYFFFLWAGLISVSTVLIHEHYVIDVLGGVLLVPAALFILNQRVKNFQGEELL